MNSKTAIAIAITLGFVGGMIAENARMAAEIRSTPAVVTNTRDTLWQTPPPVYITGIEGVIDTLYRSDTLYAFEPSPDVVARMDTILPPRGDTLGVVYHLPYNRFDVLWNPGPMPTPQLQQVITQTVIERRFFLGPYFRGDARSPWFDGLLTLSQMDFSLGAGFAFQFGKTQIDLEPLNFQVLDSKGSMGFGVSVRYYPWAN
jgi:hypothetical protein